jgi:hypothetical protein
MRRLLTELQNRSLQGTITLLEISEEQGRDAQDLIYQMLPHVMVVVHRDLEELDRVVEIIPIVKK